MHIEDKEKRRRKYDWKNIRILTLSRHEHNSPSYSGLSPLHEKPIPEPGTAVIRWSKNYNGTYNCKFKASGKKYLLFILVNIWIQSSYECIIVWVVSQ